MPTKEKKASKRFQSLKRRQCFAPLSYYFIGYKYCMYGLSRHFTHHFAFLNTVKIKMYDKELSAPPSAVD